MQTDKVKHRPCFFLMSTLACLASNTLYHQYHAHWNDLSWGHLKIAFSIVGKSQKVWDQVSSLKSFTHGIDKCLPFKLVYCFLHVSMSYLDFVALGKAQSHQIVEIFFVDWFLSNGEAEGSQVFWTSIMDSPIRF